MYSLRTIRIARVILACVALGMIALIVWLGWSVYTDYFKTAPRQPVDTADVKKEYVVKKFNHNITSYGRFFNDLQELQVAEAMANGVGPLGEADIPDAVAAGRLVKIEDSDTYYLHDVSFPYLTPAAADLLAQIGKMYHEYSGSHDRLRLTSCYRTEDFVKKLKRRNRNATENSCHLYGTTFDISHSKMDVTQKRQLAQVLADLRSSGYCFVKYERKQPCFHITVIETE